MPNSNESIKSYNNNWLIYMIIGLQSAGIFALIVEGVHQCSSQDDT